MNIFDRLIGRNPSATTESFASLAKTVREVAINELNKNETVGIPPEYEFMEHTDIPKGKTLVSVKGSPFGSSVDKVTFQIDDVAQQARELFTDGEVQEYASKNNVSLEDAAGNLLASTMTSLVMIDMASRLGTEFDVEQTMDIHRKATAIWMKQTGDQ